MKPAITILGTGRMGAALARALARAGYETTAWNRSREKALPLADDGVRIAETLAQAVAASGIVVVNVTDYAVTRALLRQPGVAETLPGKLILDLTSGTPEGAREAGRWAAAQGARYLDGAILALRTSSEPRRARFSFPAQAKSSRRTAPGSRRSAAMSSMPAMKSASPTRWIPLSSA